MFYLLIKIIEEITPGPAKNVLKIFKFDKLLDIFYSNFCTKYEIELVFQRKWAREFIRNKPKVLEYWERYRYLRETKKICNITQNSKILDVGCGVSTVLHYLNGLKFGVDPLAEEYLKIYTYPKEIKIVKGFAEDIAFSPEYFDVVFCSSVLDHLRDPGAAINRIHRVLKRKGYFILTVEIHEQRPKSDVPHLCSLTKNEVYALLKEKFEVVFEKQSPWIGVRDYVCGLKKYQNQELILILKKYQNRNKCFLSDFCPRFSEGE